MNHTTFDITELNALDSGLRRWSQSDSLMMRDGERDLSAKVEENI